jgi:phosphoribosylanthranilate isomerase
MKVKICGIRDVATARAVAALRPDAIGLNFFPRSARCVDEATAAEIVRTLPSGVEAWGVFVNHPLEEIRRIADLCGLNAVQLHGDEPPEAIAALAPLRIVRAFRVGDAGLDELAAYLDGCRALGHLPDACLIDARVEGRYGGTGTLAPWELLASDPRRAQWPPLVLAGGLTPENVAAGIETVRPWGVDVAGGVERSPGVKDVGRVARFIALARS